jgi:hypothetical protein
MYRPDRGSRMPNRQDDAAIQAILAELPQDHPAHAAYGTGADAIQLTHLIERDDLVEKLNQAWLDWYSGRLRLQARRT